MFFDIHTHNTLSSKHSVLNVVLGKDVIPEGRNYSMGIHPWYINNPELLLCKLENELKNKNKHFVFIGESGLDKTQGGAMNNQEDLLRAQIYFSEKYQKPLILHCVKAFNEIIGMKKNINPSQPWIIHGFNRKSTIAKSLLDSGCYLSFGYNFLQTPNGKKVLQNTPITKVFFETDDNLAFTIKDVYILASEILQLNIEILIKKIENNVCQITGWKDLN